jgi:hypothetical protein
MTSQKWHLSAVIPRGVQSSCCGCGMTCCCGATQLCLHQAILAGAHSLVPRSAGTAQPAHHNAWLAARVLRAVTRRPSPGPCCLDGSDRRELYSVTLRPTTHPPTSSEPIVVLLCRSCQPASAFEADCTGGVSRNTQAGVSPRHRAFLQWEAVLETGAE